MNITADSFFREQWSLKFVFGEQRTKHHCFLDVNPYQCKGAGLLLTAVYSSVSSNIHRVISELLANANMPTISSLLKVLCLIINYVVRWGAFCWPFFPRVFCICLKTSDNYRRCKKYTNLTNETQTSNYFLGIQWNFIINKDFNILLFWPRLGTIAWLWPNGKK